MQNAVVRVADQASGAELARFSLSQGATGQDCLVSVSYTHLDVYKRQAYGDLPIDLRLRPVVAPSDPSALAEVWTYVGGIWVGTFARPLAQLPEQAELVLVAAPGRTFPAAERCLIELDFREDLVTIDPGSLGGLTEAVVAQLEFTESGVTLRGVGQREPCLLYTSRCV